MKARELLQIVSPFDTHTHNTHTHTLHTFNAYTHTNYQEKNEMLTCIYIQPAINQTVLTYCEVSKSSITGHAHSQRLSTSEEHRATPGHVPLKR